MSYTNLNDNLQESLNTLCLNLCSMLNETERLLDIEKEKYNQVKSVCNIPWPVKKRRSIENLSSGYTCTCTTEILTENSLNESDKTLVNSIPKIVNKTKALRINPSKNNVTKFADAKKTIKQVISSKTKPHNSNKTSKTSINKTSTTKSTTINTINHNPSCSLYGSEINKNTTKSLSYTNLSEAVQAYRIPSGLQRALDDFHTFILESDTIDNITKKARHTFLKTLNKQNEENWFELSNKIEKLPKYMSAITTIQGNIMKRYELPCLIYKNLDDLIIYEKEKFKGVESDMWIKVLEVINNFFLPVLLNTELTEKDKIYTAKMLKTICNFSKCKVPNVPIYKLS